MIVAIPFVFNYSPDYQKMDIRTYITEGCEGADTIYAPSTNVGIMAKWYSDIPVVLSENPNDLNQWMSDTALDILGLPRVEWGDLNGQNVCIPFITNPMMGWYQKELLRNFDLMTTNRYAERTLMDSSTYTNFYVYRIKRVVGYGK
jgi:hypothetical protein